MDISNLDTLNIGIVGHIDHGKTTLLKALTGKWADTHSEELKRGITIKLGYADAIIYKEGDAYTTKPSENSKPIRYVTFVDAPGHEMLMATMLSGAAIIDAAILVIAANEGIKPQTREHLMALEAKKIKNILIVQNKIDLVSKEQALNNYHMIKEFVKGTIAENSKIIPISAQQQVNLEELLKAICELPLPEYSKEEKPIFLVARSFDINKPGTKIDNLRGGILGGALKQGTLKVGDTIEIKPGRSFKKHDQYTYETLQTKILSIKKGNYSVREALPGGSLAIETELDPSLTKADALAGNIASTPGNLPDITKEIKIQYKLFDRVLGIEQKEEVPPLKTTELLMLSINTSITVGQVMKIKEDTAEISLRIPVVPIKNATIGIARNIKNHWRLIGYGQII